MQPTAPAQSGAPRLMPLVRRITARGLGGALGKGVLFRGLVLHGLVRVWARTRTGVVASVVLTALLFAALHSTQVLTNDLSRCAALLLPRTSVSALRP